MSADINLQLTRSTLPAQVADQIQDLIEMDALHTGDKLPPERDLAERLGVSRPVVREALQVLLVRGLVKIKPGSGTFVQSPSAQSAADYLELYFKLRHCPGSLREFFEMRQLLEVETAGLAAERATADDVAKLESCLVTMRSEQLSLANYIAADVTFHLALANAAHNEYLLMLLGPLASIWSHVISISTQAPGAIAGGIAFHEDILRHISSHDVKGAGDAMRAHMLAAFQFSIQAQKPDESGACCV
ncbi:MAG: FadR/GntR family transcriptional regulator [Anaerolineae bacterium]